ncbi:MAG: LuxR family transcriptional regulator [Betaproteobacteria bacterium]|nr:LuxR family transcriptional regulator [Betaproteobacteria bacterium]MBP6646248.1 LuxR family transcriptional regulator [Burkholderiaceae bacterium]
MRKWTPQLSNRPVQALEGLIGLIGETAFESTLLHRLHAVVPAASYSIYQTGQACAPRLFMSASLGVPDTTRACWHAYLSGPYLTDRSLVKDGSVGAGPVLCHITAQEVSAEHRARVYEAHGMAERVSVVKQEAASLFAINFYRHAHQAPFKDTHIAEFEALAPALITLVQKQISLTRQADGAHDVEHWLRQLRAINSSLSPRELQVCARMLTGMTHDGIAVDLGLSLPTVKTYRNRAFDRLGIHFRNELFALVHASHFKT